MLTQAKGMLRGEEEYGLARDVDAVVTRGASLWEALRGQRLFITGGTGFIGTWLLDSFVRANQRLSLGATATVLSRDVLGFARRAPHLAANPAVEFHPGDVRTFSFPAGEFGFVIHAAAEASSRQNDHEPLVMLATAIDGTRRVLDFAVAAGARRLLFTSSGAVYGRQPPELSHVAEGYLGAPDLADIRSAYSEGKRAAELLCQLYSRRHGIEATIARCFAFLGPRLPLEAHYAAGNFLADALHGGPVHVRDGRPVRSYMYPTDMALWLWTILLRGEPCRPYNVGSEEPLSIRQLADTITTVLGCRLAPIFAVQHDSAGRPERYVPATSRAREELGLQITVSLEEGIRRAAAWYHTDPARRSGTSAISEL